jgi:hypothetical protein
MKAFPLQSKIQNPKSKIRKLLVFSMHRVATAATAELFEFQAFGRGLLIFRRYVVPFFALGALQNNVISRHNFYLNYSMISVTVPAPTVLPPSRIAKRSPFSIAIGAISSISICMLSPGITISTPSGNFATPVTSVVRK